MDSMIKMSRLEAGLIRVKPCRAKGGGERD